MLHEWRTYHCMPGKLGELSQRFEQLTLRLWERHGIRAVGFWTVVVGEDNHDFHYLLEWADLAEREQRWNAFAADPEWAEGRARTEAAGPLVRAVSNRILAPTPYSPLR